MTTAKDDKAKAAKSVLSDKEELGGEAQKELHQMGEKTRSGSSHQADEARPKQEHSRGQH